MVTEAEIQLLKSRVNELEDRLNFLYRRLNIEYADPNSDPVLSPQVQEALRGGNKIEAIKIYKKQLRNGTTFTVGFYQSSKKSPAGKTGGANEPKQTC